MLTPPHAATTSDDDPYGWMRDPAWPEVQDPAVLDYLRAENAYTDAMMAPFEELQKQLYQELRGRIQETDQSVPVFEKGYYYYTCQDEGKAYPIFCRRKGSMDNTEEVILDENVLAEGKEYLAVSAMSISHGQTLLAYSTDESGGERYTMQVKDLGTGALLPDRLEDTIDNVVWRHADPGFYYTKLDAEWRVRSVYYHRLGEEQSQDILVYYEEDPVFWVSIDLTASERYLVITSASNDSTELRLVDIVGDDASLQLVSPRREQHQYKLDHHPEEGFFILTNDQGRNFRLVRTHEGALGESHWKEVIAHDAAIYLKSIVLYRTHWVIAYRQKGLPHIRLERFADGTQYELAFAESSYVASIDYTHLEDTALRYRYESLATPVMTYALDLKDYSTKVLKVQQIPSGYDADAYHTTRVFALSEGGVEVPISLVYRKEHFRQDGSNPLYLYGYGSYGHAMWPYFRKNVISLLDRGYVFAIAHVRGGDEIGYAWYEQAKFAHKSLTFKDFIACAEHLIKERYTRAGNIAIHGGSAGGMLVGVAANWRPDLWKTVIADVPFVDVLNTMMDETLPLTPLEFKEWGNPKDPEIFEAIRAYSPYDNVEKKEYPSMLVLSGLSDPRVGYWEPTKWVAKLRAMKTDNNMLLLKTQMGAGHTGPSGRYAYLEEVALIYSFILR